MQNLGVQVQLRNEEHVLASLIEAEHEEFELAKKGTRREGVLDKVSVQQLQFGTSKLEAKAGLFIGGGTVVDFVWLVASHDALGQGAYTHTHTHERAHVRTSARARACISATHRRHGKQNRLFASPMYLLTKAPLESGSITMACSKSSSACCGLESLKNSTRKNGETTSRARAINGVECAWLYKTRNNY